MKNVSFTAVKSREDVDSDYRLTFGQSDTQTKTKTEDHDVWLRWRNQPCARLILSFLSIWSVQMIQKWSVMTECVREVWGHDLSWHGKQRVFVTMYDVWRSHTSITSVKVILFYKTQFYEGSSVLQLFSLSVEILAVLQWTVLGSTAHFGHTQLVL